MDTSVGTDSLQKYYDSCNARFCGAPGFVELKNDYASIEHETEK